jgi:hypothetical protein
MLNDYAIVENEIVINIISWDGISSWINPFGSAFALVLMPSGTNVMIGDSYSSGTFHSAPPPTLTPLELLTASVNNAINNGICITCSSVPSINSIYGIDILSQNKITSIEAFIEKNNFFPGSIGNNFALADINGNLRIFNSTSLFSEFATAVANYVADIYLYASGALGSLPSNSVNIP